MPVQMRRGEPNRRANVATARFIPLFLVGIIGYASWVVTDLVCVRYLINPSPSLLLGKRTGSAIAILVIYYLLLSILLVCYGRLVYTIVTNPGVVPRGPQYYVEKERKLKQSRYQSEKEGSDEDSSEGYGKIPRATRREDEEACRVQSFWHQDIFVCKYDGRPPFCSSGCYNYKPTRSHHCRELQRCVYKMDHFCPWVGGIVSETSFKYFIIFTFWTTLFTLHTLVVMAYFYAERRRREAAFVDVHWILILAFASLFFIFGSGMCGSSLQFALQNTTTIENISRRSHVWYLAVHVPETVLQRYHATGRSDLRLITYPRPPEEQLQVLHQNDTEVPRSPQGLAAGPAIAMPQPAAQRSTLAPTAPPPEPAETIPPLTRTFAILETKPGANPFDLGYFNNFKEVMGYTVFDCFFPLHASPCTDHTDPHCMYKTGSVVRKLQQDAGILERDPERRHSSHRKKRRRTRHHTPRPQEKG